MSEDGERPLIDARLRHVLRVVSPERGAALADLADAIRGKQRDRAVDMMERAAKTSGLDVPTLVTRLLETERRLDLLEEAVRQAQTSHWEEKRAALAKVVAMGAGNDAELDSSELILAMLDHLEPAHVRVLQTVAGLDGGTMNADLRRGGWSSDELRERLPRLAASIDLVVVNLVSRGLIRNSTAGTWDGLEGRDLWNLTLAGQHLLELLAEP